MIVRYYTNNKHFNPVPATPGSAGIDLCSEDSTVLNPGVPTVVKTGLYIELPVGYEAQVRSRSGLAAKNSIFVLNSPGTIDSDYRGNIGVILMNMGKDPYPVNPGDRIAQLVFNELPFSSMSMVETKEELSQTKREAGGFGSTGK